MSRENIENCIRVLDQHHRSVVHEDALVILSWELLRDHVRNVLRASGGLSDIVRHQRSLPRKIGEAVNEHWVKLTD